MTRGNIFVMIFCNGEQLLCSKRPSQIKTFKLNHNGFSPWDFSNSPQNKPNASICHFCYNDISDDNSKFYI